MELVDPSSAPLRLPLELRPPDVPYRVIRRNRIAKRFS
jgi:hypothetical protein